MKIRRATAEDCPAMLELIRELAVFERAPDDVTVDPTHFEQSGFGDKPVWWAFVAEQEVEGVERIQSGEIIQTNRIGAIDNERISASTSLNLSKLASTPTTSIIAFALYYIRYSTWKGQVMYLEDIIVTEKMRGAGLGTMLMDRLIEEAKEKGFKRISWQVLDWNEAAVRFYNKYDAIFDQGWVNVHLEIR